MFCQRAGDCPNDSHGQFVNDHTTQGAHIFKKHILPKQRSTYSYVQQFLLLRFVKGKEETWANASPGQAICNFYVAGDASAASVVVLVSGLGGWNGGRIRQFADEFGGAIFANYEKIKNE